MIPIRDTSYQRQKAIVIPHPAAKRVPRSASKKHWKRLWQKHGDAIVEAIGVVLVFGIIIGAFYVAWFVGGNL